ncbi:MAG: hypothetical protein HRU01_19405 [Myxococcales bacterium]|nr:hypothetical protein [Myxococcales bacterium]
MSARTRTAEGRWPRANHPSLTSALRRLATGLVALGVLGLTACSETPAVWVSLDDSPDGTPAEFVIDHKRSSPEETVGVTVIHGYWKSFRIDKQTFYTRIEVPGLAKLPEPGAPDVQVLHVDLAIPPGDFKESSPITEVFDEEIVQFEVPNLLPILIGETDQAAPTENVEEGNSRPARFVRDEEHYASKQPFPTEARVLEARVGTKFRSIKTVELNLAPMRWNPSTGIFELAKRMTIRIAHPVDAVPAEPITPERARLAEVRFRNWELLKEFYPVDRWSYRADYLIIYPNDDYADEIRPLALQKWARGYWVTEMTVDEIGGTCKQIQLAINAWEASVPIWHDAYALLVGDTDVIPLCTSPDTGDPTDDLYASTNGGDLDEEIFLGRLSVDDEADAANQIQKILTYEDSPAFFCCYDEVGLWAHKEGAPGKYVGAHETVRTNTYSVAPDFITHYGSEAAVSDADIRDEVDNGVGVLAYRGHGSAGATATSWDQLSEFFGLADVLDLVNPIQWAPVVWAFACSNSDLDFVRRDDSIAEIWMEQVGSGSVSYYGSTVDSYTSQNHVLDEWMFLAVFDEGLTKQSHAIERAEAQMAALSGSDNAWMYLLLGDPDMDIRRRNPVEIKVLMPEVERICKKDLCTMELFVLTEKGEPIEGARVGLWKAPAEFGYEIPWNTAYNDEISYASRPEVFVNGYTDADGRVVLEASPRTEGEIRFSVQDLMGDSMVGTIAIRETGY